MEISVGNIVCRTVKYRNCKGKEINENIRKLYLEGYGYDEIFLEKDGRLKTVKELME